MLAIKLKRIGKKHQAAFRIVVAERRSKLRGGFVEDLGFSNPHLSLVSVDRERVKHWISKGAKPTDTVYNILVSEGVITGKKISVHGRKKSSDNEGQAKE